MPDDDGPLMLPRDGFELIRLVERVRVEAGEHWAREAERYDAVGTDPRSGTPVKFARVIRGGAA